VIRHLPGFCGDNPNERPAGFDEKKLHRAGKLKGERIGSERRGEWRISREDVEAYKEERGK